MSNKKKLNIDDKLALNAIGKLLDSYVLRRQKLINRGKQALWDKSKIEYSISKMRKELCYEFLQIND